MNVKDKLVRILEHTSPEVLDDMWPDQDTTLDDIADLLLWERDEESAEKIRQEFSDQWEQGNQGWDAHDAADLIDPKVM